MDEVRRAMPKIRVVRNPEIEKGFRSSDTDPSRSYRCSAGDSIVIEYTKGHARYLRQQGWRNDQFAEYDWHLLNLRNYANLGRRAHLRREKSMGYHSLRSEPVAACSDCPAISPHPPALSEPSHSYTRCNRSGC